MVRAPAALLALLLFQAAPDPQPSISLMLDCGERPDEVVLSIRNSGKADTAVLLGIVIANGRWHVPRELIVELERAGIPNTEQLIYRSPAGIAGRIDHWIVGLPVRSTFTLILRPTDFVSISSTPGLAAPRELTARLTGRAITSELNADLKGLQAWRLWTGTVRSNSLQLSDCAA
jgi:hypothetical protein